MSAKSALSDADLALGAASKDNRTSGGFNETVRIRGMLDGGGSVYGRLIITNLATANQLARVRLSVSPAGKPTTAINLRRKKGTWSASADKLAFKAPDRKGSSVDLQGTMDALTWTAENHIARITVTLTPTVKPMDPPGGAADFGNGKFFRTTLLAPHAKLAVKLVTKAKPDGSTTASEQSFTGWAYAEKRTSNLAPYLMARRFIDVREYDANGTFALSMFQRSPNFGGKRQGWMVCVRDGNVVVQAGQLSVKTEQATPHAESGYSVPQLVRFEDKNDPTVKGVVKATKLARVYDDLRGLSKLERVIAERFAKPWTFRHEAAWALRAGDKKMSGGGSYSYNQLK